MALEFPGSGFDTSALTTWTLYNPNSASNKITTSCGAYTMVGGFLNFGANAYLQKTYTGLSLPHYSLAVYFDFYKIDSWTSENFILTVDTNTKTYQYGSDDGTYVRNLCGGSANENFNTIYDAFSHSANSVTVTLSSNMIQDASIASWGINNFQLSYFLCHPTCLWCSGGAATNCLTCYNNASLISGGCQCNTAFVMNSYTTPCTSTPCSYCCHEQCQVCTNGVCSVCVSGYYLIWNECLLICRTGCAFCTGNMNSCTSCLSGYYLTEGTCETTCYIGTFPQASDNTCQACDASCQGCSTAGSSNCVSCNDGSYLSGGQCLVCNTSCSSCLGGANVCMSCPNNLNLYQNECMVDCPSGYYIDNNNTCSQCNYECAECSNSETCTACQSNELLYQSNCLLCDVLCQTCSITTDNCLSCYTGTYLYENNCWTTCLDGYWSDPSDNTCKVCDSSCEQCTGGGGSNNCIACFSNATLINNYCVLCVNCLTCSGAAIQCLSCATTMYLYDQSCSTQCPTHYYPDTLTNTCIMCSSNCVNCSGPYLDNCTSCNSTAFLIESECVLCYHTCLTCETAATYCLTCASPLALFENECISTCPDGYYNNTDTQTCDECDPSCLTCQSPGTSTSCLTCADGFYLSVDSCLSCPIGCAICLSATNCTSCLDLYFLLNYQCLGNCATGYWMDIGVNQCKNCDISCVNCSGPASFDCIACQVNQALVDGACYQCDSNCSTCNGIGSFNCLSCTSQYYLQDSNCVPQCGTNYYVVLSPVKLCLRCSYSCKTCLKYGDTQCLSCNETQYLSILDTLNKVGICYQSCPLPLVNDATTYTCQTGCQLGEYLDSTQNECMPCDTTCLTCKGSNPNDCLSCSSTLFLLDNECLTSCPDDYYSQIVNNINGVCSACSDNCQKCSNSTVCLVCVNEFYVSTVNYSCTDCSESGTFIDGFMCGLCSYGCDQCESETNCTVCQVAFYLNETSCLERTHLQPTLTPHPNITFLYYLSFNDSWPMLFGNLTYNKSSYSLSMPGLSIKNYKYVLQPYKFQTNTWELMVNVTININQSTNLTFTFLPPGEVYYNLNPESITLPVSAPFTYCGYLKIYNNLDSNCENLTVVTPTLSMDGNERVLLQFSSDFPEFFAIFSNITTIYLEDIPKSNYNCTLTNLDTLNYNIFLSFNQSLLNNPVLVVEFGLPGYIIMDLTERLIPSTLTIAVTQYYTITPLAGAVLDLQQGMDNNTLNGIFPLTLITSMMNFGGVNCFLMLGVLKIKYLRYIQLTFPPNALSVFGKTSGEMRIFDFTAISQETANVTLPTQFVTYGVKVNFLYSLQEQIAVLLGLVATGVLIKVMTINTKSAGLLALRKAFYLNASLLAFSSFIMDLSFFTLVNVYWYSVKSSKGAMNLIIAAVSLGSLIMVFIALDKALRYYCPVDETEVHQETHSDFPQETHHEETTEKKTEDFVKKPSTLSNIEISDVAITTKSPTIHTLHTESATLDRKTTTFKKNALKEIDNFSLIAKPTLIKKIWWDEKDLDNTNESNIMMSTITSKRSGFSNKKLVNFKEEVEEFLYNPYRNISEHPNEDWSFMLVLTRDFNYKTDSQRLFVLYSLMRDFIFTLILVIFAEQAYYALLFLSGLNVMFFVFLVVAKPFKRMLDFIVFLSLEVCVGVCLISALAIQMLDQQAEPEDTDLMNKGWAIFYGYLIAILIVILKIVVEFIQCLVNCFRKRKNMKVVPIIG